MNSETNLPGPLDVVLRHLHLLWCHDDGCPPDRHLRDSDPEAAAIPLSMAIWDLAERASDEDRACLERLSALVVEWDQ